MKSEPETARAIQDEDHAQPDVPTIVNPRTGQTMMFRETGSETNGERLRIESIDVPHSPREPEHIHPYQESRCRLISGALTFRVGGRERVVHAGEEIIIPAGVPHQFWNHGEEIAHHMNEFHPALRTQLFFETLFGLARNGQLDEHGMPKLLPLALLVPAFGDEIRPVHPLWPLLRAIAWLLTPLALLRGYRRP